MSFLDFFRKLFIGSNNSIPNSSDFKEDDDFRSHNWNYNEGNHIDPDTRNRTESFSFNIYSNPIEMHRFFEQQMNEMLKSFFSFDSDFDSSFGFNKLPGIDESQGVNPFEHPDIKESPQSSVEDPKSLRELLLKPEFRNLEKPSDKVKVDTVLDGKVDANDIVRALDKEDSVVPIWSPKESERMVPKSFTFSQGRSLVSRIVRRPDGSVEREEIIKNSDGSETKTVTRSLGDHEYTITTHRDATGVEQRTENFKNIDPDKLHDFDKAWSIHDSKWWSWWNQDNKKPGF